MYEVSIIIPYKNTAGYLKKLLDSIFIHTIPFNLQVIVVNDNSDKNLEEYNKIVNEFSDRIEFYNNDTGVNNAGAARNVALKYAKGKWLLFADADDCFVEGWEQVVAKYINSDSDVIYFSPTSSDDNGKPHTRNLKYVRLINEYLKNSNQKNMNRLKILFLVSWSKLIRNSIIQENNIKFDEVMHAEDYMFTAKYGSLVEKITVSNEIIYCVYYHKGTLTTFHSFQISYQRGLVYCNRYNFLKSKFTTKEFKQLGLDRIVRNSIEEEFIRTIKGDISIKQYIELKKLYYTNHLPFMINPIRIIWKSIVFRIRRFKCKKQALTY